MPRVSGQRWPRARPYTTALGHVRLNVRDLRRAIDFYTRILQLDLTERGGDTYAFLSRGRSHHVVALFQADRRGPDASARDTRVDHVAFEVRGRTAFARAFKALTDAGVPVTTVNNGISWSLYFGDPDGNSLEIFRDMREHRGGQKLWRGVRKQLGAEQILAVPLHASRRSRRTSAKAPRRRR